MAPARREAGGGHFEVGGVGGPFLGQGAQRAGAHTGGPGLGQQAAARSMNCTSRCSSVLRSAGSADRRRRQELFGELGGGGRRQQRLGRQRRRGGDKAQFERVLPGRHPQLANHLVDERQHLLHVGGPISVVIPRPVGHRLAGGFGHRQPPDRVGFARDAGQRGRHLAGEQGVVVLGAGRGVVDGPGRGRVSLGARPVHPPRRQRDQLQFRRGAGREREREHHPVVHPHPLAEAREGGAVHEEQAQQRRRDVLRGGWRHGAPPSAAAGPRRRRDTRDHRLSVRGRSRQRQDVDAVAPARPPSVENLWMTVQTLWRSGGRKKILRRNRRDRAPLPATSVIFAPTFACFARPAS